MFIPVLLFTLGLFLLIIGGNRFVDGATGIAYHFHIPELIVGATIVSIGTTLPEVMVSATSHIPELIVGATIVSIGTTLPEVMVSATSAIGGHGEIAYGNAIGSIICNTSLIAAVTLAVRPGKPDRKALFVPVLFFFGAAAFYSFTAYRFGHFSRARCTSGQA